MNVWTSWSFLHSKVFAKNRIPKMKQSTLLVRALWQKQLRQIHKHDIIECIPFVEVRNIYTPCNWIHWASPDCWHHNLGLRMRCFKKYPTKNGTYWCFPSNSRFASENKKALVVTSNKLKSIVYPRHSSNHMSEWQSSMSSLNCCQMWCAKHIAKCLICSV